MEKDNEEIIWHTQQENILKNGVKLVHLIVLCMIELIYIMRNKI